MPRDHACAAGTSVQMMKLLLLMLALIAASMPAEVRNRVPRDPLCDADDARQSASPPPPPLSPSRPDRHRKTSFSALC